MIKVTIILFVLSLVSTFVTRLLAFSLKDEEKLALHLANIAPARCIISTFIMILLWIATAVCAIIMIIKW